MIDSDSDKRLRRESPPSVLQSRAAKRLVADAHEHLGAWHAETIKLETSALRLKGSRKPDAGLVAATEALFVQVQAQSAALELAASDAPPEIANHSRVTDTLKVLAVLSARLETLVATLGESR